MKQDEVLQTLRKVIAESDNFTTWTVSTPHLVELVKRAIEAEREAILDLVDSYAKNNTDLADAIRARGNK